MLGHNHNPAKFEQYRVTSLLDKYLFYLCQKRVIKKLFTKPNSHLEYPPNFCLFGLQSFIVVIVFLFYSEINTYIFLFGFYLFLLVSNIFVGFQFRSRLLSTGISSFVGTFFLSAFPIQTLFLVVLVYTRINFCLLFCFWILWKSLGLFKLRVPPIWETSCCRLLLLTCENLWERDGQWESAFSVPFSWLINNAPSLPLNGTWDCNCQQNFHQHHHHQSRH